MQPMDRHCQKCLPLIFPLQAARRSVFCATLRWHDFHCCEPSCFLGLLTSNGGIIVIVAVFFTIITHHWIFLTISMSILHRRWVLALQNLFPTNVFFHIPSPLWPSTLFLPALPQPLFSCGSPYLRDKLQETVCLQGTLGERKCGRKGRWCIGNCSGHW